MSDFRNATHEAIMGRDAWINTKDCLPADGSEVIVWNGEHVFAADFYAAKTDSIGRYHEDKWVCNDAFLIVGITHWMPLPSSPHHETTVGLARRADA